MNELKLDAMPKRGSGVLIPIIVKTIIFTIMITFVMVLIYSDMAWVGFAIYAVEVCEFALFIFYLATRRRKRA